MTQPKKQRGLTVAITGAGSGLGRELALGFSAKGYRVFGTVHSANEIAELLEFADIRS
jgi:NAD(P)-dependent dehydrogenase (short-subunit alcohol dehydrogenase family)